MANPPTVGKTGDDGGTPRWVKVCGIIALVVVLLFVIVLVAGGGGHGPSRHSMPGGTSGEAPPSLVVAVLTTSR